MPFALFEKVLVLAGAADEIRNLPTTPSRKIRGIWERPIVDRLVAQIDDRNRAIPLPSKTGGHRQGESFAVAVEDLDFGGDEITIQHQVKRVNGVPILVPPKGGKVRAAPLPRPTAQALKAHIAWYGTLAVRCDCCDRVSHVLFFTADGGLLKHRDWNRDYWHPALRAVGITPNGKATG